MRKLSLRLACVVCVFCAMAMDARPTDTFTTLASFSGSDGANPGYGSLVQGLNGDFYGTTDDGSANCDGAVFEITPGGKLTTLYSFCSQSNCADGYEPHAGLVQAANGNFYGTAVSGGAHGAGTVFELSPAGKLTALHSFDGVDGAYPDVGLVQAGNGNFYGITSFGAYGFGTVFEITPTGKLTTLHSFAYSDGAYPSGELVHTKRGKLYGVTISGGTNVNSHCASVACGTIFEISRGGKLTTLHSFCSQSDCSDGYYPGAGLVQGENGDFYGTTEQGGANSFGTVFEITAWGKLTTLYSFCSRSLCTDGAVPFGRLVHAINGKFYGITHNGGAAGYGTIFQIAPSGRLTTLYSFCSQSDCVDGRDPFAGLVQATDGNFYGTTSYGGTTDDGTVFSVATGLEPFVEALPTSGKVGALVKILGNDLTGATSVTFNGTTAAFTVVSSTEINTTVPSGATTGKIVVTTPSATLTSKLKFRVRDRLL